MRMTEDKKYMVLTLYDGKNYREEERRNTRGDDRSYPHNEDKFRNFEAGKLTFMGESFDTNLAKKWIDAIKSYIILT